MAARGVPTGIATAADVADDFAQLSFVVHQVLSRIATCAIVRVTAVSNDGEVSPVGTVSVEPLVLQVDGVGRTESTGEIHNAPYFRLQGGVNAVICDPAVGDLGVMVFTSHDSSKVKTTKDSAPPGSKRRFSWSDGLYIGGLLNGAPQNYIQFDSSGDIRMKPASKVYIEGGLEVTEDVVASGVSLVNHLHPAGSPNTGKPIPS